MVAPASACMEAVRPEACMAAVRSEAMLARANSVVKEVAATEARVARAVLVTAAGSEAVGARVAWAVLVTAARPEAMGPARVLQLVPRAVRTRQQLCRWRGTFARKHLPPSWHS